MRRKDREVADLEGQLAILEQCPVCRVAINDPASGVPYLVPLNFGMAAGPQSLTLYFHCAPVGTKLDRSEEHTSELQSRFGITYAVFCLKKAQF